jgi:hypothetical protein
VAILQNTSYQSVMFNYKIDKEEKLRLAIKRSKLPNQSFSLYLCFSLLISKILGYWNLIVPKRSQG